MRAVASPGRWVWAVGGLVTILALAIPLTFLITHAGIPGALPQNTLTRTVTVPEPVTSLNVQSYGGLVHVTAGPTRRVEVTETMSYDPKEGPPAVTQSVSGGRLTLADPACNGMDCGVGFTVIVPRNVAVTALSEGGPVVVSGTAGANLNSAGGFVRATAIDGPLTVTTGGGPLILDGLTGPLRADTAMGPVLAQGVNAATAMVITGGGDARIAFTTAPDTVLVSTDGGGAALTVPGGPYAVTADNGYGGPVAIGIAVDPAASRSITISSAGGPLMIEPAASRPRAAARYG